MIGQLEKAVLDCPDPRALATFYCEVLGMQVNLDLGDWAVIGRGPDRRDLACQRVHDYSPPTWPQAGLPQQMHLSRLDRGEVGLDACPPEVAEVLAIAEQAARDSGGAFSVHLPGPDGRRRLDPSGVVKGWAVQRAAAALRALPETDHCLSAGGDMTCLTVDPDAEPWRVGVEDPSDPTRLVAAVPVFSGAVATSGTAHRGQHLLDARTELAPHGVASVTVVAGTLTAADVDATAAYAQGLEAAGWLARRPGRSGLVVWQDGTTTTVEPVPVAISTR